MNDLYKFVDIIKEHEEVQEGFEDMELATGATLQPLREKIDSTLNLVYGLISYVRNDVTDEASFVSNVLSVLERIKEGLES